MELIIQPYSDRYREEVLALWAEALPLDAITNDILEQRVLLDENFDPETFLLAFDSQALTGLVVGIHAKRMPLGDADPDGTCCWITALAVRNNDSFQRTTTKLLVEIENRFRQLGKKECRVSGYPPGYFTPGIDQHAYAHLVSLFRENNYTTYHEALSMDASIVLFQIPVQIVAIENQLRDQGIRIRSYQRTDLVAFLAFLERSMPTDWVRVERRNLRKIIEGGFHPEQIMVVTAGEQLIGYCQFEGSHFGPFGIAENFQGKGIGTVLLARTLERMRMEGYHDAWVMWTDDLAAKVYEKFGFKQTRRFSMMKKAL
ncbi:MAG: GNAT family N-acetyltransferase [bacterium]